MPTPSIVRIISARVTGRNTTNSDSASWSGGAPPDGTKLYLPVLSNGTPNTPSGWTVERGPITVGAHNLVVFQRTASSEPSGYTMTWTGNCNFYWSAFAVADAVTVTSGTEQVGTGDPVAPSITVPASTLVVGFWGGDNQSGSANIVYTPPAGFTDENVPIYGRGSAGVYLSAAIASQVMSGATGSQTGDSHSSTGAAIGFLWGFTGTPLTQGLVVGYMTLN